MTTSDLNDLETYFNSTYLPTTPVQLMQGTTITDIKKFIESHLFVCRSHVGQNFAVPFHRRLLQLKELLLNQ